MEMVAYLREKLLIPLLPFVVILGESGDLRVASIQLSPNHEQFLFGRSQLVGHLSQLRIEFGNAFALVFTFSTEWSIAFAVDGEFVDLVHQKVVIRLCSGCLGGALPLLYVA